MNKQTVVTNKQTEELSLANNSIRKVNKKDEKFIIENKSENSVDKTPKLYINK